MLVPSPEDQKDDSVLNRFLMILVRYSSGHPAVILSPAMENGRIWNFLLAREGQERVGVSGEALTRVPFWRKSPTKRSSEILSKGILPVQERTLPLSDALLLSIS